MRKTITEKWLNKHDACFAGMAWFLAQPERNSLKVLKALEAAESPLWFYWLATKLMTKRQIVKWAIGCAASTLHIFETQYPEDQRPRKALQAAKAWLRHPSKQTVKAVIEAAAAAAAAETAAAAAAETAYAAYMPHRLCIYYAATAASIAAFAAGAHAMGPRTTRAYVASRAYVAYGVAFNTAGAAAQNAQHARNMRTAYRILQSQT